MFLIQNRLEILIKQKSEPEQMMLALGEDLYYLMLKTEFERQRESLLDLQKRRFSALRSLFFKHKITESKIKELFKYC